MIPKAVLAQQKPIGEDCNPFMPNPCVDESACLLKNITDTKLEYACHSMVANHEHLTAGDNPENFPILFSYNAIPMPQDPKPQSLLTWLKDEKTTDTPPTRDTLTSFDGWKRYIMQLNTKPGPATEAQTTYAQETWALLERINPFVDEAQEQDALTQKLAETMDAFYATVSQAKTLPPTLNKTKRWVLLEYALRRAFKDLMYEANWEPLDAANEFLAATQSVRGKTEIVHDEFMIHLTVRLGQTEEEIRARSLLSLTFTVGGAVAATAVGVAVTGATLNPVLGFVAGTATSAACSALHNSIEVATGGATANEALSESATDIVLGSIPVVGHVHTAENVVENVCGIAAGEKAHVVEAIKTGAPSPLMKKGIDAAEATATEVAEFLDMATPPSSPVKGATVEAQTPTSQKKVKVAKLSLIYTVWWAGEWADGEQERYVFF